MDLIIQQSSTTVAILVCHDSEPRTVDVSVDYYDFDDHCAFPRLDGVLREARRIAAFRAYTKDIAWLVFQNVAFEVVEGLDQTIMNTGDAIAFRCEDLLSLKCRSVSEEEFDSLSTNVKE